MNLKESFDKAVADSKAITKRPDNDTLLKLYSLYMQATKGNAPDKGPSNPFDFIEKAKHNAWSSVKDKATEAAMTEYIEIIAKLTGNLYL